jgi:hypothetical protein
MLRRIAADRIGSGRSTASTRRRGARVKITEACADRIPVVSTALGAESLGADDGSYPALAELAKGWRMVDAAPPRHLDAFRARRRRATGEGGDHEAVASGMLTAP